MIIPAFKISWSYTQTLFNSRAGDDCLLNHRRGWQGRGRVSQAKLIGYYFDDAESALKSIEGVLAPGIIIPLKIIG